MWSIPSLISNIGGAVGRFVANTVRKVIPVVTAVALVATVVVPGLSSAMIPIRTLEVDGVRHTVEPLCKGEDNCIGVKVGHDYATIPVIRFGNDDFKDHPYATDAIIVPSPYATAEGPLPSPNSGFPARTLMVDYLVLLDGATSVNLAQIVVDLDSVSEWHRRATNLTVAPIDVVIFTSGTPPQFSTFTTDSGLLLQQTVEYRRARNQLGQLTYLYTARRFDSPVVGLAYSAPSGVICSSFAAGISTMQVGPRATVLAHEIGHTLGYAHVSTVSNIMYPYAIFSEVFAVESIDVFRQNLPTWDARGCLLGQIPYRLLTPSLDLTQGQTRIVVEFEGLAPTVLTVVDRMTGREWTYPLVVERCPRAVAEVPREVLTQQGEEMLVRITRPSDRISSEILRIRLISWASIVRVEHGFCEPRITLTWSVDPGAASIRIGGVVFHPIFARGAITIYELTRTTQGPIQIARGPGQFVDSGFSVDPTQYGVLDACGVCRGNNETCQIGARCFEDAGCITRLCIRGVCSAPLAPGASCDDNRWCASNICITRRCCSSNCSVCQTCNASGLCVNMADGRVPREECPADGKGQCISRGLCLRQQCSPVLVCVRRYCFNVTHVVDEVACPSSLVCPTSAPIPRQCPNFLRCNPDFGQCLNRCLSDSNCAPGYVCASSGVCIPGTG